MGLKSFAQTMLLKAQLARVGFKGKLINDPAVFYQLVMRRIILLTLLLSSCTPVEQPPEVESVKSAPSNFQLIVPNTLWEDLFFRGIDERAKIAELPSLRSPLPKDDLEVRVWIGFGLLPLEGFVLKRTSGTWSAVFLNGINPKVAKENYQKQLATPKSGWDECWRKLVASGILTLPDAEEINCLAMIEDGTSYVVEINNELTYRTYMYDDLSVGKCEQAKQMSRIAGIIAEEFDLSLDGLQRMT